MLKHVVQFCVAAVFSLAVVAGDAARAETRPHIVVIVADDLGYADCGFNGGTQIATPHLDRLAAAGTVFDSFYVQPVCSPTRAALMTGRYPIRYGLQVGVIRPWATYGLPLEEQTLAAGLRAAGYTTAISGKWHLGSFDPAYHPLGRGFQHAYGHLFGMINYETHERDGKLDWWRDGRLLEEPGYSTHLIGAEAVRRIEQQAERTPLFLYVPFNAVHTPLQVPDDYLAPYDNLPRQRRLLAGMLAAMDEQVGRIAAAVERRGWTDDTLFLFTSDNGGPSPGRVTDNGPLRAGKGTVYEGGVRVCAFGTWPGRLPAGARNREPMHIVDWYPTLLRVAGAAVDQRLPLDGIDVWDTMCGTAPSPHDAILLNASPAGGALRAGDWKLVVDTRAAREAAGKTPAADADQTKRRPRRRSDDAGQGKQNFELYDLSADLGETRNVAAEHPDVLARLRGKYEAFATAAVPPKNGNDERPGRRDARADTRPNIVLVFADDLGITDIGCYGRGEHHTPHLDRLAAEGVRFTAAYCAQPICSPSRAALMTGKCPARLNLTNYLPGRPDAPSQKLRQPRIEGFLPLEEVTVAEVLKGAGYATGLFGKWHLGGPDHSPQRQGFDVVESPPANTTPTMDDNGLVTEGGKSEFAITAAAETFMETNRDRPFFCYVPHNNPHIPLAAAPDLVEKNRAAFHPTYAAMIETLDLAVGRLLAKVESLGLAERTIFIFTSDNGGLHVLEFPGTPATHNAPYRAGKGYVYEGGLREPLLVRWPGVTQPGRVCDTPVVLTDLVPTLLEAAGIDPAQAVGPLDGVSLTGLLRGDPLPPRPLFWHFPNYTNQGGRPAGAIREGDWKLVEQFEDGSLELYELAADVGERRNLATAEPERTARMLAALRDWRARVGARMPTLAPDVDAALHRRLYVEQDSSRLEPAATAAAMEPEWQEWRAAMNAATKGRKASVTPARGDIRLHARDARVHGETLRYEPQSNKDVLGFWTKPTDWAEWEFEVMTPGRYEVEIQQGCGGKSGGAEVAVEIGGGSGPTTLPFTVQETGHFQQMILRVIGEVKLTAGRHTLAVKPRTKPGVAVMDLRRVVLRPVDQ